MNFFGLCWRIFLIGIALIFFEKLSFDPLNYIRSATVPLLDLGEQISQKKNDFFLQCASKEALTKLCKKLAQENATLQIENKKPKELEHRIRELERLLKIHKNSPIKTVCAQIIKREISAWNEQFFINKGEKDGICPNDLVLSCDGIIGKINKIQPHYSTVLLSSDPKFQLSVKISKDHGTYPSIFSGKGYGSEKIFSFNPRGIVKNIPVALKNELCPGDAIIPVIFQDSFFELPLGWIESCREQGDGLFLEATVKLPDLQQVRNVLVIHNPEQPII